KGVTRSKSAVADVTLRSCIKSASSQLDQSARDPGLSFVARAVAVQVVLLRPADRSEAVDRKHERVARTRVEVQVAVGRRRNEAVLSAGRIEGGLALPADDRRHREQDVVEVEADESADWSCPGRHRRD